MFRKGIIIALVSLILDQFHKWIMLEVVQIDEPITVLPFFNLVMVWNKGISFGMFHDTDYSAEIFSALALVIVIILLVWLKRTPDKLVAIGIGLIIGGAIGNVIDRLRFGAVADFLDFHVLGYHWPAFNIADSSVFIGAVILCIDSFISHDKSKSQKETGS